MEGTRGRCLGRRGVETSEAAFCSMWPVAGQPLEPTADGGQRAGRGGLGEAAIVERAEVGADVGVLDAIDGEAGIAIGEPGGEAVQLAAVGAQGVRRGAALAERTADMRRPDTAILGAACEDGE